MLSFPASNWEKARQATRVNVSPNLGYGSVASRINSRLYLSGFRTASDTEKLSALGITHVISVLETQPNLPEFIHEDRRLHLPIPDQATTNILEHLPTTTAFIIQALDENDNNKVLVHCMLGISRSATVICAYLIATRGMTAKESIEHVKSIRGIVDPNMGFRRQLDQYSTQYPNQKAPRPHTSLPGIFKLGSGIATRMRKSNNTENVEKHTDIDSARIGGVKAESVTDGHM